MHTYPGLKPWDVYRLTWDEIRVLIGAAKKEPDGG